MIANTDVQTSPTVIFQSSGESAVIATIFCNVGASDAYLDVHLVQSGFSASNTNKILSQIFLPIGETFSIDTERFILSDSDSIQAVASNSNLISATVSYLAI